MNTSKWFIENDQNELSFGYKFTEPLFQSQSDYQDVKVINTQAYGKMLILDNLVMLTESDEFVYHELISHVPVSYHKAPKSVLIIGGGDGGTVRELVKHDELEKIVLCEIDKMVIDVSKQFFPKVASQFNHPKVDVKVCDGINFVKELNTKFDIIIIDSSDPVGPGEGLFTSAFYKDCSQALNKDGILVAQSESPWATNGIVEKIYSKISSAFKYSKPYIAPVATYPRGLWSWTMASNSATNFNAFNEQRFAKVADKLNYLTPTSCKNIFDIPPFYKRKLLSSIKK